MPRGHHDHAGEHSFSDWYEFTFGHTPEHHNDNSKDVEEGFKDWYDDFVNAWFDQDSSQEEANNFTENDSARRTRMIAGTVVAAVLVVVILTTLIVAVVCCCLKKKRKFAKEQPMSSAGKFPIPAITTVTNHQQHPKEVEAMKAPFSLPVTNLPPVETSHVDQQFYEMNVEVVKKGTDAPDTNPREYIEVFSPPPPYNHDKE